MLLVTGAQMRELDRRAMEGGIPSLTLMENAGRAVAEFVLRLAEGRENAKRCEPQASGVVLIGDEVGAYVSGGPGEGRPRRAAVFCGPGNNGGDGLAVARLLMETGWEVRAVLVGDRAKLTPDAAEMERRLEQAGVNLESFIPGDARFATWCFSADVLVDAILGVGLRRPPEGDAIAAIQLMNKANVPVVAVDIASGVEADTGKVPGAAVAASHTVTFTMPKIGHCVGKGAVCCGALITQRIGIPDELVAEGTYPVRTVERGEFCLPKRPRDAHKGDFGRLYIIAGSVGMTGAPVLAARAALRSGAGLVTLGVPPAVWPIAAAKLDEAMAEPLPDGAENILARLKGQDVCLIGPGLGRGENIDRQARQIIRETRLPLVLDADGINALEGHIDVLDGRAGRCTVLTPHDGEFARIGGELSHGDRLQAARDFAAAHGCCLVLKGHRTITAFPDGTAYVNTTGNPGMAKGGSGDVLAGVVAALLAQGLPAKEAVPMAVWLHGHAGDLCAEELGEYGMLPGDIIRKLPQAILSIVIE